MDILARIEQALDAALAQHEVPGAPPKLAAAIRHAVFPGGARIRPQLCIAVARACGDDDPALADAAAVALELMHCASLVHDDLPCFDNAATRRGRPSVQAAYGEPLAVLAPTDWDELLYPMYSRRCRVTIVRAADELSFGTLDAARAAALGLEPGAAAVRVEREAFDLAGRCVELRTTYGDARDFRYRAEIR